MFNNRLRLFGAALALSALAIIVAACAQAPAPRVVNLQFVNHIQAQLPEQDVFMEASTANQVARLEGAASKDAANLKKMAYATASATAHDPFKMGANPLGPYSKGAP